MPERIEPFVIRVDEAASRSSVRWPIRALAALPDVTVGHPRRYSPRLTHQRKRAASSVRGESAGLVVAAV